MVLSRLLPPTPKSRNMAFVNGPAAAGLHVPHTKTLTVKINSLFTSPMEATRSAWFRQIPLQGLSTIQSAKHFWDLSLTTRQQPVLWTLLSLQMMTAPPISATETKPVPVSENLQTIWFLSANRRLKLMLLISLRTVVSIKSGILTTSPTVLTGKPAAKNMPIWDFVLLDIWLPKIRRDLILSAEMFL